MFKHSEIIVGVELGTSKVCVAVGEVESSSNIKIIGLGQARSRGVRKGEVVDTGDAVEDLRNAVVIAEEMADAEIRSVYLGVTGNHLTGFNNRGVHHISSKRKITQDDVNDVVKNAKGANIPEGHCTIHNIRQYFTVDEHEGLVNPVGMEGTRMEVEMHVLHGKTARLATPKYLIRQLQLETSDIAFNGMASALAVLTPEQKELGTLVLDFGGGTLDYVVFVNGITKATGVLGIGGDHISNDLAIGLNLQMGMAEHLKIKYGTAIMEEDARGRTIELPAERGLPEKTVSLENFQRIMSLRLEETFQIIYQRLAMEGILAHLRHGIVLCGGCARIPHIDTLISNIFHLPVAIGRNQVINSLPEATNQPEFMTALGLVIYGTVAYRKKGPWWRRRPW